MKVYDIRALIFHDVECLLVYNNCFLLSLTKRTLRQDCSYRCTSNCKRCRYSEDTYSCYAGWNRHNCSIGICLLKFILINALGAQIKNSRFVNVLYLLSKCEWKKYYISKNKHCKTYCSCNLIYLPNRLNLRSVLVSPNFPNYGNNRSQLRECSINY